MTAVEVDNTGRSGDNTVANLTLFGGGAAVLELEIAEWRDRPVRAQIAVLASGKVVADSPTTGGEEIRIVTPNVDTAVALALKAYLSGLTFAPVQTITGQAIATNAQITVQISQVQP